MKSAQQPMLWHDHKFADTRYFVGIPQDNIFETTSAQKAQTTIIYPVHIVLLTCLRKYRSCLIEDGHIFVEFLSVPTAKHEKVSQNDVVAECSSVCESNSIMPLAVKMSQTSQTNRSGARIAIVRKAVPKIMLTIRTSAETEFGVVICGQIWKCHPFFASYC